MSDPKTIAASIPSVPQTMPDVPVWNRYVAYSPDHQSEAVNRVLAGYLGHPAYSQPANSLTINTFNNWNIAANSFAHVPAESSPQTVPALANDTVGLRVVAVTSVLKFAGLIIVVLSLSLVLGNHVSASPIMHPLVLAVVFVSGVTFILMGIVGNAAGAGR